MRASPNEAMVLAAGRGERMRPLSENTPKPLIKVDGKPLIDYALDRFTQCAVKRAVVNVHYLADQVETHLLNRTSPAIIISDERERLLDTGGGLKKARRHFDAPAIFCTNTDAILIDAPVADACATLATNWDSQKMDALLLLTTHHQAKGYRGAGDFERKSDGRLVFAEGRSVEQIFTGLQIISTALIDEGPDGAFSTKLLWERANARGRLYGVMHDGRWLHVGDPDAISQAETALKGERR